MNNAVAPSKEEGKNPCFKVHKDDPSGKEYLERISVPPEIAHKAPRLTDSSKWEITALWKGSDGKTIYRLTCAEAFSDDATVSMQFHDEVRILVDPNGNVVDVSIVGSSILE